MGSFWSRTLWNTTYGSQAVVFWTDVPSTSAWPTGSGNGSSVVLEFG